MRVQITPQTPLPYKHFIKYVHATNECTYKISKPQNGISKMGIKLF